MNKKLTIGFLILLTSQNLEALTPPLMTDPERSKEAQVELDELKSRSELRSRKHGGIRKADYRDQLEYSLAKKVIHDFENDRIRTLLNPERLRQHEFMLLMASELLSSFPDDYLDIKALKNKINLSTQLIDKLKTRSEIRKGA